jgi:aminoglycoside phosphotransferase (APT) family kinase protein
MPMVSPISAVSRWISLIFWWPCAGLTPATALSPRLHAVIDFGTAGVGDPSCDLVIAWTLLDSRSREEFRSAVALDPPTWRRGRGWAIWKALITLVQLRDTNPVKAGKARQTIRNILDDHE